MMKSRLVGWALPVALPLLFLPGVIAQQEQQSPGPQVFVDPFMGGEAQTMAYWTPERMAEAVPMTPPARLVENMQQSGVEAMSYATPGLVNGWSPGSAPYVEQRVSFPRTNESLQLLSSPQAFGTAPTNPLSGPYGPFQRWTMQGSYTPFPRAIHGKLFFSMNGGNYVCSGTVIGRSTIATAGHCVSDGTSTFGSNFLFCPSYYQSGQFPGRGCWAWAQAVTSNNWHNGGDPDYDYGCLVAATTSTLVANKIGNVTGWAGRAWNWVNQPVVTFGYPQGAPFPGNTIQQTVSTEWYDWDFTAGGQVTKIIGSDLTGGSSGGGWFLSWRAPGAEVVDTDNSDATDPAGAQNGPYINGVNSHKRCRTNCNTPPIATAGLFWQEMTSPPFREGAVGDLNESEDVFAICLAHGNNNASAPAISSTTRR